MISLCKELAQSSKTFLPYYFLKNVFKDMAEAWEGEALPADKADIAESFLVPEINKLVKLIEEQASKQALFDIMNEISSACSKF